MAVSKLATRAADSPDQVRQARSQPTSDPRSQRRYWLLVLIGCVFGALLRSPVLYGTLISDDWDHYAMVEGIYPVKRGALDLFDFVAHDRAPLLGSGRLPWWSAPDIQIAFLRPLASLFTYADYAWLDAQHVPFRAHAHSLAFWLLSLVAVAGVLGAVLPKRIAVPAFFLYVVDEGHSLPVAWSASRAEIISAALLMFGLWAGIVWSQARGARYGLLSGVCCGLALLAGEHTLSLVPYFLAFALVGAYADGGARLRLVAPCSALVLAYLIMHAALGYGVRGSSYYADPVSDVTDYLSALPRRIAWLLGDVVWGYSADWSFTIPSWAFALAARGVPAEWLSPDRLLAAQTAVGVLAIGLVVPALAWLWVRRRQPVVRTLCWLLLGACLSLPPLCSAFSMTRLTVAPALGFDTCLAALLVTSYTRARANVTAAQRVAWLALGCVVALLHVVLPTARSYAQSAMYAAWSSREQAWVQRADFGPHPQTDWHVFVVSAHDSATRFCLPFVLHLMGVSPPASAQTLLPPALAPLMLKRLTKQTLEASSPAPHGLSGFMNSAYRPAVADFRVGQRFLNPHFTVEIVQVVEGIPSSVRFTFERPLEDASYVFMYPAPDGLQRLELPPVGASRVLPPPAVPTAVSSRAGR